MAPRIPWMGDTVPMDQYDRYFGGPGSAEKAARALSKEYGAKDGRKIFYAIVNRRKATGRAHARKG